MPEVFKFDTSSYEDHLVLKKRDSSHSNDHLCLRHTVSTSSETFALSDDTRDLITLKEEQVIWFTCSSDDEDDDEYEIDHDPFDKDFFLLFDADDETDTKENLNRHNNNNNNNDKNDVLITMENNDCQNKQNEVAPPTIQTTTRLPLLQITEEYTGIDNTISMEVSITPAVGHMRCSCTTLPSFPSFPSLSSNKNPKNMAAATADDSFPINTNQQQAVTAIQDIGLLSPLDMNKRFFQDIGFLSRLAMTKKFFF